MAPDSPGIKAELFDGASARLRSVVLDWDAGGIRLAEAGGGAEVVGWDRLRVVDRPPGMIVIGHRERPGWRLRVPADAPADLLARLLAHLPRDGELGGWIDRLGLGRALAVFALASAAVVTVVVTAPAWLGPLVPMAWERWIGEGMLGDLGQFNCRTPASEAALADLAARIDPGKPPVRVQLVKVDMVNAVAVPGGRVLVFDKLVQDASSPDELAGVIGHEIGHVRKRHVMQALLRQFGLSVLLSGANSSATSTLGQVTALSYSRSAEAEADAFARERLAANAISPLPTAAFFTLLANRDPTPHDTVLDYFASHPDSGSRAAAFRAAARPGVMYRPALSDAQFAAIRAACKADPQAKEWSLF